MVTDGVDGKMINVMCRYVVLVQNSRKQSTNYFVTITITIDNFFRSAYIVKDRNE